MKKVIFAVLIVFILVQFSVEFQQPEQAPLRLHVVANSNSQEDQSVKLKVRDDLLCFSGEAMADAQSSAEAEDYVLGHIGEIAQNAKTVLTENGFDYTAAVSVGEFYFPEKQYGDTVYPAGNYQAVKIVLGEGKGDNWWCVIFPPLCIVAEGGGQSNVSSADKKTERNDKIAYKSIFAEIFNNS